LGRTALRSRINNSGTKAPLILHRQVRAYRREQPARRGISRPFAAIWGFPQCREAPSRYCDCFINGPRSAMQAAIEQVCSPVKPTGRANARPMTGSATKQSSLVLDEEWIASLRSQ